MLHHLAREPLDTLLKELAARAFHAATGAPGELVSVNCAAIPAGVAERLLFGTRRGAYSGATVFGRTRTR